MSITSAVPERLLGYGAELLAAEASVASASDRLEDALQRFEARCPELGFCATPRGPEIARHAQRGQALAEWVAAVGAAFLAADTRFVGYLPGAVRSIGEDELRTYLDAVGAYPLLEQQESHHAGITYAARVMAMVRAGEGQAARDLLRGLADYEANQSFMRGALLALGDLDDLADSIDAVSPRPNAVVRFLGGAWDATTGTVSTLWGLTGQALYDPSGAGRNWGDLGGALVWGWHNPGDFALAVIDWEGLKDDPARWLGGLAPDAILAVGTAGAGAAVSRSGSATRAVVGATARGLRTARSLDGIIDALRPLSGLARAGATDVGTRMRTIGDRQVTWTPSGYADEAGNITRVHVGASRGPLARLEGTFRHDPSSTFRSSQYLVRRTQQPMTLYRVGNPGRPVGNYWTAVRPSGPGQSQIDSALRPDWGNTAQEVTEIRVPAGTTIYEGMAGPQALRPGASAAPTSSGLLGDGHQVFLPHVPGDWIIETRPFRVPGG